MIIVIPLTGKWKKITAEARTYRRNYYRRKEKKRKTKQGVDGSYKRNHDTEAPDRRHGNGQIRSEEES